MITQKPFLTKGTNRISLELELKNLEINLNSKENRRLYNHCQNYLETIYDYIAAGIKTRSKCEWYKDGEKSYFKLRKKASHQKSSPETHC